MKQLLMLLVLSLSTYSIFSQTTIPDFKSNVKYINNIDTILKKDIKEFDLIIAYRNFSNLTKGTEYHLLVLNKEKWQKATFTDVIKGFTAKEPTLTYKAANSNQCASFYNNLVASNLFTIEDDKVYPCCTERDTTINGVKRTYSFGITDGQKVEMWVITHKKSRHLFYYAPDFYVKYCSPNQDRRDLNNIVKLFAANW